MTGTRGHRRAAVPLAFAGFAVSLVPMVYLHAASIGRLSPITHTISDYIFVDNGTGMLALAAVCLAAASLALLVALIRSGLPRLGPVAVLMGLWLAGLTAAAVFPTDPTGAPTSVSGLVHRYAAAVMFASLPLAGWLISRTFLSSTALRRFSVASGITSLAFMASHAALSRPGSQILLGLMERILFLLLYGLLFAIAAAVARREVMS